MLKSLAKVGVDPSELPQKPSPGSMTPPVNSGRFLFFDSLAKVDATPLGLLNKPSQDFFIKSRNFSSPMTTIWVKPIKFSSEEK
jgi:hypothetical protein